MSKAEQAYQRASDYYYQLERDAQFAKTRRNWLAGARHFEQIAHQDSSSRLAPASQYMSGRVYQRMYQRFHLSMDLDRATATYDSMARRYPKHRLADDAAFAAIELHRLYKNDPKTTARQYQNFLQRFPNSDKKQQALARFDSLNKKYHLKLKLLPSKISDAQQSKLVTVLPIQHWSSDDYTRVVIRTTGPADYTERLLEKSADHPRRLYLDFLQSFVPAATRTSVPIDDGLLKRVRTGQFSPDTARVVLDIESIDNYKIFNLKDPFRVVIDVHGQPNSNPKLALPGPQTTLSRTPSHTETPTTAAIAPQPLPPSPVITPLSTPTIPAIDKTSAAGLPILADNKKKKPKTRARRPPKAPRLTGPTLAQQLGLGVRRIVIDPGHGGKDPGASSFGLQEKDIVLKVARKTAELLRNQYGFNEVLLTRDQDTFLPLTERTAIANTNKADLFVSIHVNAHPSSKVGGVETFFLNLATNAEAMRVAARENATTTHNISDLQDILSDLMNNSKINESARLATGIQQQLVAGFQEKQISIKDLGVKQAPFYVLLGAQMPAVLAEISFITNQKEAQLLGQDSHLSMIAARLAAGIIAYTRQNQTAALP